MTKPVILHAPHSSLNIPPEIRKSILLSDEQIEVELMAMTDRYTDDLFFVPDIQVITSPVSRLAVDMERFRNEADEVMSQVGMGAVYQLTSHGHQLRILSPELREQYLQTYYDPYHKAFEDCVESMLKEHGKCLIIDCHSFPSKSLPYEINSRGPRPDICLGTSSFHTPDHVLDFVNHRFAEIYSVDINHPFAGTFVPGKYYLSDKRVISVMIEINRKLYMDEYTGQKATSYDGMKTVIRNIIEELIDDLDAFF